jgi:outer membrane lipoprotein SlyB
MVQIAFLIITFSIVAVSQRSAGGAPEIPVGTDVHVRMIDSLTSAQARVGDIFHGTLEEPILVNGKQVFPKGADVTGTVVAAHESGRLTDPGQLSLALNTISSGGVAASINVKPLEIKGESHKKSTATKAGGGALLGALIGGIAGGGKGAAIGAGAGAAAGTGAAAATGKKEAVVESEAVLDFVTSATPTALPTTTAEQQPPPSETPHTAQPEEQPKGENPDQGKAADKTFDNAVLFTARDRRVIRNCLEQHAAELPPGTLEKPELPSGSDRQIRVGGMLPTEADNKAQSLPLVCETQLPSLPGEQERVVYSGRVLLIDNSNHILDLFDLSDEK